jgi:hypothetical protein
MGGALRKFHDKTPARNLPDKGRFKRDIIPKLQGYYGKAIKNNIDSVDAMYNAIWATWYHMSSTNKNPMHEKCPLGEDSWCWCHREMQPERVDGRRKDGLMDSAVLCETAWHILTAWEQWMTDGKHMFTKSPSGLSMLGNQSRNAPSSMVS